jgi:hypothetical protein
VYISFVQHSKERKPCNIVADRGSPWILVFPAIAAIFIVGVVAGGLAALLETRNARRDRMEMKRYLRKVELAGR